ncbi:MAG: hypothetical protein ABIN18_11295 [Pseudomonadota bacterium]
MAKTTDNIKTNGASNSRNVMCPNSRRLNFLAAEIPIKPTIAGIKRVK